MIKEELLNNKDEYLILRYQKSYSSTSSNYHYFRYAAKIINYSWRRISFSGFWIDESGRVFEQEDHLSIFRSYVTSLRKCCINEKFAVELNLWKRFLKMK